MNPEKNTCPYDYQAIRGMALDFGKYAGEVGSSITFADEMVDGEPRFRVQVFAGENILTERLYEMTYTRGKEIIEVWSYHRIPEFDGYIDLRAGKLPKHFRILHHNAGLRLEP